MPLNVMARIACRLLWLANSNPPSVHRTEFYALKQRLLERYGRRVGEDWQEITQECWNCDGTGIYQYSEDEECWRCNGTGVYDRFWVRLERWDLCGRIFHRPAGRVWKLPEGAEVRIKGRIAHKDHGLAVAREAALWLAFLFDRPLFRQLMSASCVYRSRWLPLLTIQQGTFAASLWAKRLGLEPRTCVRCDRRYRRWFRKPTSHVFVCHRCDWQVTHRCEDCGHYYPDYHWWLRFWPSLDVPALYCPACRQGDGPSTSDYDEQHTFESVYTSEDDGDDTDERDGE